MRRSLVGLDSDNLARVPFVSYNLPEDKGVEKSWTISVRLNEVERAVIGRLRVLLNIESDSKALKKGAEIGLNVLQALFSEQTLKYLTDGKRDRLTDYQRGKIGKSRVL